MTENPSSETLADAAHVTAADGGETVESSTLSLAELNKYLGSDFKDPSTALKALKDTKDYVGKRKEDIANELKTVVVAQTPPDVATKTEVQALKNDLFYSQNPQYKGMAPIIQKLGADPADVVNSEEFKTMFEKVKVADEVVNNKSVVASNSRISQVKTVMDSAVNVANSRGTTGEDVATIFAREINQQNNQ